MLMGLCRRPNVLFAIKIGDLMAWEGNVDNNTTFTIDADSLFGGDDKEGGVSGEVTAMFGAPDQDIHATTEVADIMTANGSGPISDLRGPLTLFFKHGHITTNNPYPKPWKFRVTRTTAGWFNDDVWYAPEALILMANENGAPIYAMNPAHMLYQVLTDPVWGRGLPVAALNETSFVSAANTLCVEKFGLSFKWSRSANIDQLVQMIVNHIAGALYADRATGLLTLKLFRDDYDPDTLPIFDYNSGLLEITEDVVSPPNASHSEIIVGYTDPIADKERQVRIQNLAGTVANQALTSTTVQYQMCPTAELAARLGQRDMSTQAGGIRRLTMKFDRRGRKIQPGGVFKVEAPSRGITSIVMRAGAVKEGTNDDPTITVIAIEDVFKMEATTYFVPTEPTWTPPDRTAVAPTIRLSMEATYREFARFLTSDHLAALTDTDTGFIATAVRPTTTSRDFLLKVNDVQFAAGFSFCPTGTITANCGYYDTSITLQNGASLLGSVVVGGAAYLDGEWVRVDSINTSTRVVTISRGTVDSVPMTHATGARIWFGNNVWASDGKNYAISEDITIEMLTRTSTEQAASGALDTLPLTGRQALPYPPGNLQYDGHPFGSLLDTDPAADTVFTWSHRDRLAQLDHLVVHSEGDVGPEAGVTYTINIKDGFTNVRTVTGITAGTWTYTVAMKTADALDDFVFQLFAVRDGLESIGQYFVPLHLGVGGDRALFFEDFSGGFATNWIQGMPWETGTSVVKPTYLQSDTADTPSMDPFSTSGAGLQIDAASTAGDPDAAGKLYFTGLLSSNFTRVYGYFEFVSKMPDSDGSINGANWLYPVSATTPPDGEIDVIEHQGDFVMQTVWDGLGGPNPTDDTTVATFASAFHKYAVDWQSDFITFYIDGVQTFQTATPANLHDVPMMMILSNNIVDPTSDGTTLPKHMIVQTVGVWENKAERDLDPLVT